MKTLDNIIQFLIDNPTVDCVEWKGLKIYEQGDIWSAEFEQVYYGSRAYDDDEWEDDWVTRDIIAESRDVVKFKEDIIDWLKVGGLYED